MKTNLGRCITVAACLASGCQWVSRRSDFDRDPFVMSHLTHNKNDPLFTNSENDELNDDPIKRSASTSRKFVSHERGFGDVASAGGAHADNFQWIEGRLVYRGDAAGGWFIAYDESRTGDRFGGQLRIDADAHLGVLREGDRVRASGSVVQAGAGDYRYRVDAIHLLD